MSFGSSAKISSKPIFWAVLSFIGLILSNFILITVFSKSASFALGQMLRLRIYIFLIALGFSAQVFLIIKLRSTMYFVSGAGALGTGTMVACCVHHITESLPFLALGGLGVFFLNYQKELLISSIIVNWAGVLYMVKKLRRIYEK